ncbi:MAG: hypothetical protein PHG25_01105 [Candidatus Pacebacteria bacterium]|nr:hypothetical protein [Candidatus Paceibacterota bacterium]
MIRIDIFYSDNAGDPVLTFGQVQAFYEALKSKPPFGGFDQKLSVNMIKCEARFGQQANGISVNLKTVVMKNSREFVLIWVMEACRSHLLVSCGEKRPIYIYYANTQQEVCLN